MGGTLKISAGARLAGEGAVNLAQGFNIHACLNFNNFFNNGRPSINRNTGPPTSK